MTGFEPQTYGLGSDHSANWATTTAQIITLHMTRKSFRPNLKLREHKILVRYFSAPRVNEFLRITIGTDEQMQRMIEVLKSV